ncbi:cullin-2-like [Daphnia pulicaria]|uniref:cullin-2-like n=1 Tax=Daphnia pulicaria TaxID=35523 RepID=UPI001EEC9CFD|nr:cullin-2-like [Daphnia pulicaria]
MSIEPRANDFGSTWANFKEVLKCVVTLENISKSTWENAFSNVYFLCVATEQTAKTYKQLYQETQEFLEKHVKSLLTRVNEKSQEKRLTEYYTLWQQYSKGMEDVNNLYKYLNDNYIQPQRIAVLCGTVHCIMIIEELGLHLWKKYVIALLKAELLSIVLGALHDDRTGLSMTCKEKSTRRRFLEETGEYYRLEASQLLQEEVSKFMTKILERLDKEDVRSAEFLQKSSYIKVRRICEERMVVDQLEAIQNECPTVVQNERKDDLRNAFKLLKLTLGELSVLASHYGEHIKK